MQNHIPIIFRAWKEMVFEKKAKRLHVLLSSGSNNASELDHINAANTSGFDHNNQSRVLSTSAEMQNNRAAGGQSQLHNWKDRLADVVVGEQEPDDGLAEDDDNYEEYFFRDQGEADQYVKVVEDDPRYLLDSSGLNVDPDALMLPEGDMGQSVQKSCHILPIDSSNFYHDHNKYNINGNSRLLDGGSSSNGSEVDQAISIQEDYDDDEENTSEKRKARDGRDDKGKSKKDKTIDEDDPQI